MVLTKNCLLIFVFKHSVQKRYFTFCIQELCPKTIFWFLCSSVVCKKRILLFVFRLCVQKTYFGFCAQKLWPKTKFFLYSKTTCTFSLWEKTCAQTLYNFCVLFFLSKQVAQKTNPAWILFCCVQFSCCFSHKLFSCPEKEFTKTCPDFLPKKRIQLDSPEDLPPKELRII